MTDDRALSEALGFVLVFSIIVTSVGLVYAMGYGGLQDTRDVERVNNAERAFDILADNTEDITQRSAPSRATEIKLADARLAPGDPVTVNVSAPAEDFFYETDVDPVVYDSGDGTTLRYVAGAIVRAESDGAVMVREPDATFTARRTLVPVAMTRAQGSGIGGSATVLVRAEHVKTATSEIDVGSGTAYVNVTTPEPEPWRRSLDDRPGTVDCEIDGETVICLLDTDRIAVAETIVDYTITS